MSYKRPFDLALVTVAGLLLLPVWLVLGGSVALAIWIGDRGPVFYRQRRVGRDGEIFELVKFRTMVADAETATGPIWASPKDPRTTKVGKLLRRLHLDELPQCINIFKGEMSLVGPRPERPELIAEICAEVPQFVQRLRVRPGIAGLAQAHGGYHAHPRIKLRYDNLYIANMNPLLDLKLLILCAWRGLMPAVRDESNSPAWRIDPLDKKSI